MNDDIKTEAGNNLSEPMKALGKMDISLNENEPIVTTTRGKENLPEETENNTAITQELNNSLNSKTPPEEDVVKSVNYPELWIEIHDVSPGWEYWRLEEVLNLTEKKSDNISKIVLFVIPNHSNTTPISIYPEYTDKLNSLTARGYILGMHGLNHFFREMNVSIEKSKYIVETGLGEFEKANLSRPIYFVPPGWVVSPESSEYLEREFEYVYYADYIKTPEGKKEFPTHEYTWYDSGPNNSLETAKSDFLNSTEVFRLTLHLEAVNNPDNLRFLSNFLEWNTDLRSDGFQNQIGYKK